MKKQHLYRLSAILLFLCIFLGIMPRHALQATAAEAENTFPEGGKIYNIGYTYNQGKILREGNLSMYIGLFLENGTQTTSRLDTNGKLSDRHKLWLRCAFSFEKTEDGYYKILPVCMPGRCLQLGTGYRDEPGVTVGFYEGKPEQKWILTPLENGGYHFSSAAHPDAPLGEIGQNIYPTLNDEDTVFTFYLAESPISFPSTRVYVKAPEDWYPGIWVYPSQEDVEYSWHWEAVMEQGEDGWYSFPSPSGTECKIVNHVRKGVGEQHYEHDDIFDIVDTDFSTDKWVVITDDPNVAGDLTYKVYDYNPDDPPPEEDPLPKEGVLYALSLEESETRIHTLEFALHYGSINAETLACGPLIADLYDKSFHHNKPDLKSPTYAFYFKEVQEGYYAIIPAAAPDVCLQVILNEYKAVTGRKFDNKPEQLWTLTPCEGGIRISNAAVPDLVLGLSDDKYAIINVHMTTGEWVFKLEESQIVFPEHRIHVKAPDFWAPCIAFNSRVVFMPKKDGWYSYYYIGNHTVIENLALSSPMAQVTPPDFRVSLQLEKPNQDYWVVISDDPNVDGDLSYKLYDYNPDDEPPKTADPVMLAIPAFSLLASAIAMAWLLRRKTI